MSGKIITLFIALTCCAAAPALSQEASGGVEFFQSTLEDILDTPLLAASFAEEKPSDAAATAYVITAETMDKRGYFTLADLLEDMPQFQVQRNSDVRRLNLVSVRGIPYNERLVILYDGVRVTPPTGDLLTIGSQFSLKNAERVEIVLGPMSSVYGADAFSGVINVVTRRADGVFAGGSYGSFSTRAGLLSAAGRRGNSKDAPRFAVMYDAAASDGPELPDVYRKDYAWYNGQYQQGLARQSVYSTATVGVPVRPYDAAERSSFLDARMTLGDFEAGLMKMRESHSSSVGVKPEYTLYTDDARFITGYWTLYARHAYTPPDESWKLATLVSHYRYMIDPDTRFINSFSAYTDAYKYASAQTNYFEQVLSFEPAEGFPVLAGISYQDNSVLPYTSDLDHEFDTEKSPASQNFYYTGSTIAVDFYSLRYSNTGAFMRLQTPEVANTVFTAGLRYDYNTAYGETWNPRAGLVWKPGEESRGTFKILYGEAYLAPSPFYTHKHFGSFIATSTAAGYYSNFFHVPNEALDPEKVRSVEAAAAYNFGHGLRVSLNPYYNKVRDLIQDVVTGPGTFHGMPVYNIEKAMNTGTMESYGATLRADAVVVSGNWRFEPWVAYTYSGGNLDGDVIPFNSEHTAQGGVSLLRGRWVVTPKLLFRSHCYDADGGRVGSFVTADLYARYTAPRISGFSVYLQMKNLFDRRYYNAAYGGGADHMDGAPQNPFEASAGFSIKF